MKKQWYSKGLLVAITAPSGAGKTTVIRKTVERNERLHYSISATTRPRREKEVDGRDYFFLSEADFLEKIKNNLFAEWADVHGYKYGTLKSQIDGIIEQGSHVIMDVDVQGARSLRKIYPEGVFIFLLPPSMEKLKSRLSERGTEDEEAIQRRLRDAASEIESLPSFDYMVINDNLDLTVKEMESIISAEELKVNRVIEPEKKIREYLAGN